ncbi:hypothetical protein ACSDR0_37615 [Streptosporangium sp. G11]|uniref:hypothetical protein n=1 Tax=Streptosporangium sp. G11 TaxID=3436926 RepID=UPI003EBE4D85
MQIHRTWGKTVAVVAAAVGTASLVWLAAGAPGLDGLRWTLGALLTVAVTAVAIAVLLGPVARRMAGEPGPLTARDRKRLSVKDRIDTVNIEVPSGFRTVGYIS